MDTAALFMKRVDQSVCMRSRVVEEKLAIAKERGVKQLVILGAGLDSTAYRCTQLTGVWKSLKSIIRPRKCGNVNSS